MSFFHFFSVLVRSLVGGGSVDMWGECILLAVPTPNILMNGLGISSYRPTLRSNQLKQQMAVANANQQKHSSTAPLLNYRPSAHLPVQAC